MYNLWIGLRCLGVSRYWGNSINKYVAKPQLLKWMNKWVFNDSNNCLMICGNCFHPASRQKYGTDFSLSEAYHEFLSHLLKLSRNYGRYTKSKPQKTNHSLLTGMPCHFPCPAMMDAGCNASLHHCLRRACFCKCAQFSYRQQWPAETQRRLVWFYKWHFQTRLNK